jgi:histidinol dehydrogenase
VAGDCSIDFFAGPSEIVVVSSDGSPAWIAADLIAQAEHDPDARAILLTPNRPLAAAVAREIARQLPGDGPARQALAANGGIILTKTIDEAVDLSQRMAPEHLVCDSDALAKRLTRAGTVFVGRYSAQAAGDYATGSNHVLPTSGAAGARGGLSAADFVRVSTVQRLTAAGLRRIAPTIVNLAEAEGLTAHAESIRVRFSSSRKARP